MEAVVWIGAALTILGLAGIVASVVMVVRARRAGLDEAALRARLSRALPVNVGALLLSILGLLLVLVGVLLG